MPQEHGQSLSMSLGRRIICDLVQAGMQVPLIPIQKDMNVAEVAAARQVAQPRPSWCSIFTKAYAKVVAARPELRRACLTFPWVRMFEDPATSVDIAVDAFLDDENVLIFVPIKQPEACPLLDIDRIIAWSKERPIERLPRYRRARRLARLPRLVREWVWWSLLNVSGHQRSRHFGTFGVSSMAKWGVDSLRPISPCVTVLHYGTIDAQGRVAMRLTFDHRVMDGSLPSQALVEMEQHLKTDVLAEVKTLQPPQTGDGQPASRAA